MLKIRGGVLRSVRGSATSTRALRPAHLCGAGLAVVPVPPLARAGQGRLVGEGRERKTNTGDLRTDVRDERAPPASYLLTSGRLQQDYMRTSG
jgi:hypothetical protein